MAILAKERVLVREPDQMEDLEKRGYGERDGSHVLLSPEEALYLNEKQELKVESEREKALGYKELMKHFTKFDKDFPRKYLVFRDLKNRGFCVKTGFKFGSHYRVYARGEKPGSGHAVWLIHCIPEEFVCDFSDISRAVRLAQNVRKKMIYAVLDKEGDITYYKIERMTP
jgi:tRNA-intron endonuclease